MQQVVTALFPAEWRQTVSVRRMKRDTMGGKTVESAFTITNCILAMASSNLIGRLTEIPSTEIHLYCPPGSDLQRGDEITIPRNTWHPQVIATVEGDPKWWPLGTTVKLNTDSGTR